ncbi:FMN-binding negative transcriptional regulator [Pseudoalteromonas obscura]|uniref:FMN-binding negative transcriptional regulator n=1 Tax=Pseudoalteromonas obscura TaxID=3048491 RepID=A0ABT7EKC9_9GAMM|nr:FMN-binding negative transcriptional regulator [Pseudoalteromonas sp. P94(2023)]MDK2595484.1 FMN-binding negative transcriptional regulator [Pseudoalteromonas sp. P94(2023)]
MNYPVKTYVESDNDALFDVIERFPLATLFCKGGETAPSHICHLPVSLCRDTLTIFGHATGENPIKHFISSSIEVVFRGPDTYLSPKQIEGIKLPTWDYVTVHCTGTLESIDDFEQQVLTMQHILNAFENDKDPWQLSSVPEKQLKAMCNALIFFKVKLDTLTGNFKLSQNKSAETRAEIANLLCNTNPQMSRYYDKK